MRDDLIGLLEKADLALGSSRGVIDVAILDPLIDAVKAVRTRLAYPEDVLVVALVGGTGSGKSSLFNVLADEELVEVGGIRPTTSHPAAAAPASAGDSLSGYLDRLGIVERHIYEGSGLCLIDLPDMDSVEIDHRHRVDEMLPLVDVVLWVTDPEKYRDARLHHGYLQPLSPYSDQFIFVMNQIDRLSPTQADEVSRDLAAALKTDGLDEVAVIPTAAAPPSGPPNGIDRLFAALETKRERREILYGKLLTDLAETSRALTKEIGTALDFDTRADNAVSAAADLLSEGDAPAAVNTLTGFLDRVAADSETLTADVIEHLAADVATHLDRIQREVGETLPERQGWFRRRRVEKKPPNVEQIRALLNEAVIRPARAVLARRALAIASISELAVEVESLRNRPGH